jgi:hypothetical protein
MGDDYSAMGRTGSKGSKKSELCVASVSRQFSKATELAAVSNTVLFVMPPTPTPILTLSISTREQ